MRTRPRPMAMAIRTRMGRYSLSISSTGWLLSCATGAHSNGCTDYCRVYRRPMSGSTKREHIPIPAPKEGRHRHTYVYRRRESLAFASPPGSIQGPSQPCSDSESRAHQAPVTPRPAANPSARPGRLSLVEKRADTLARLIALPTGDQFTDTMVDHALIDAWPETAQQCLGAGHGAGRTGKIRRDLGLHRRVQLRLGHRPCQQIQCHRLGRIETTPRHEVAARLALAHARTDIGADRRGNEPQPGLGQRHQDMIRPDRHVTDAHQPDTATKRIALKPPDQRLGQRIERLKHLRQLARLFGAGLGVGLELIAHPAQVAPGAECLALRR